MAEEMDEPSIAEIDNRMAELALDKDAATIVAFQLNVLLEANIRFHKGEHRLSATDVQETFKYCRYLLRKSQPAAVQAFAPRKDRPAN
jgi:hypothetical protein